MHLMFSLSGLFVWPSLVRKGGRTFLHNRIGFAASSTTRCFALVALFLRFAVRRPMLSNLSKNAYGIYLIHYVFVIWLQYVLLGTALFAIIKAAIVFLGTLTLSWITSAITCRIPLVEYLISGKTHELVRRL